MNRRHNKNLADSPNQGTAIARLSGLLARVAPKLSYSTPEFMDEIEVDLTDYKGHVEQFCVYHDRCSEIVRNHSRYDRETVKKAQKWLKER